jgi:chromosome segregation ATPase
LGLAIAQVEQSRKEVIAQMWTNAKYNLQSLKEDCEGIEQIISDKGYQIKILIAQRNDADERYDQAVKAEEDAADRVARENSRLQISKGTPAEAERAAILQSLLQAHDDAKADHEKAKEARDEAHRRAELIAVLQEEISEAQAELTNLQQEQRNMEALRDEQHWALGVAERDEIRDKIDAAKARRNEALQIAEEAEKEIADLQRSISERLRQWQDLRDQLLVSYGKQEGPESMSPNEHILRGYLEFCNILGTYGPRARRRVNGDRQPLAQAIALPENYIAILMGHNPHESIWRYRTVRDRFGREIQQPVNNQIEIVEALLEDEKPNRRSSAWS